jgi:hypothetical protein
MVIPGQARLCDVADVDGYLLPFANVIEICPA